MALATIARRLQRTHSLFFLPTILKSPTPHPVLSSPEYSQWTRNFFRAFHQTPGVPASQTTHEVRSSASHPSLNLKLYQTINLNNLIDKSPENNRLEVSKLLELLCNGEVPSYEGETTDFLDVSGVKPNKSLINSVIWALRDEWKLAFLVFKWGERWGCNCDKNWSLMIWVLGNHKKFNTAWCLIRDLYRSSMDTQQAMFIMIDRYAAANDPAEAIRTFQMMEIKFKHSPDQKAFYTFLDILCKHGNVEEAEEFMYLNKKLFPLETEGFNIILNGWCDISIDVLEAKRVWREMARCCILPDATTYTHMISCYSKHGNLFDSLRLYDEMNKREWVPGREVYNCLIYVLARENCLKEALKMVDKMKEKGFKPDSASYNSMICPLCEAGKLEDARTILATMTEENVNATIDTYHSVLEGISFEGTLEILDHMAKAGLGPQKDTFCKVISKFLRLDQPENALKIWVDMKNYKATPDSGQYTIMIEGLIRCGLLVKAREIYAEMVSNGNIDDPKLKKLLEEPATEDSCKKGTGRKRFVKRFKKGTDMRHANCNKQSRTNAKCSVISNPLKF